MQPTTIRNGVVTISSNNAAYTIALLGGNHTRRKLIAIKLNVDTARTNTGAIVELYGSDNTTRQSVHTC